MKQVVTILFLLLWPGTCFASGWNDFELDIGDNYRIFRSNSLDVSLGKAGGQLLIFPRDYNGIGPLIGYYATDKYIFTKNYGAKPRGLFEGDTFQDTDIQRVLFFILVKRTDEVIGPLSQDTFIYRPEVSSQGPISWKTPRNPNFWRPLLGSLMFVGTAIPILAVKFFWISIPVVVVGATLFFVFRRRKHKRSNCAANTIGS